ncbi:hypothetical protein BH20ACI2_BH20ACI2_11400 [soil metagenome]
MKIIKSNLREFKSFHFGACARLVLICLLTSVVVYGQQQNPVLRGTVTDESGALLPGVMLTLANESAGITRNSISDASGEYQFQQLPVGTYRLRVERSGFKAFDRTGIELLIGRTVSLDIALEIGNVGESVTVEAGTSTISSDDAALGNSITKREVESLPSAGRNPITLFSLQPGIVFTGESDPDRLLLGINNRLDDREGAVFGVRGNQSAINIDGAEVGDTESQAAFGLLLPVTLDSIKEFRVTTNGANASEFNTGGQQVTIITNNGTNDFRGNVRFPQPKRPLRRQLVFQQRAGCRKTEVRPECFRLESRRASYPRAAVLFRRLRRAPRANRTACQRPARTVRQPAAGHYPLHQRRRTDRFRNAGKTASNRPCRTRFQPGHRGTFQFVSATESADASSASLF